jgi:3-oxoadipate CoA-transferase beta subunit
VRRIYTNLAVLDVVPEGLLVREMVDGLDFTELQARTEAHLVLANDWRTLAAAA